MSGIAQMLRELAHVKATFQLRSIATVMGSPPPAPTKITEKEAAR